MSKGLGGFALNGELKRFIKRPEANFVINQRGHKVSLPRYYRKKYLTEEEQLQKNLYISGEIERQQIEEEAIRKGAAKKAVSGYFGRTGGYGY